MWTEERNVLKCYAISRSIILSLFKFIVSLELHALNIINMLHILEHSPDIKLFYAVNLS